MAAEQRREPGRSEITRCWLLRWHRLDLAEAVLGEPTASAERIGALAREGAASLPPDSEPTQFDALYRRLAVDDDATW